MISVHTRTARGFVFPLTRSECRELAAVLLDALELEAGDLELCLVDDAQISELHEQHLGGIGPTNVLAFPSEAEEQPEVFADAYGGVDDADDDAYADDPDDTAEDELAYEATAYGESEDCDGPEVFLPEMLEDFYDAPECAEEGDDTLVAGSIVFSVDALHRECVLYDQEPGVYFARLLAHALLHLSGVPHGAFMEERMEYAVSQALAD